MAIRLSLLLGLACVGAASLSAQTSFDHDRGRAATPLASGILTEGYPGVPTVSLPAAWLGLTDADEIDALSFGDDASIEQTHTLIFSPGAASLGLPGTGTSFEVVSDTPPGTAPAAAGDLFQQVAGPAGNIVAPPGLGFATGTGTGDEANASWTSPCSPVGPCDDLDAFDYADPTGSVLGVYFSLKAGSPTLAAIPASPGDVLYSDLTGSLPVVATLAGAGPATASNLGIDGHDLDALVLVGTVGLIFQGAGVIDAGAVGPNVAGGMPPPSTHLLEFSVGSAPGMNADVLVRSGPNSSAVHTPAGALGLLSSDNVDALEATPCAPSPATVFSYNGSGINLDTLTTSAVVIGSMWTATLTPQPGRAPGAWALLVHKASFSGGFVDLGLFLFGIPAGSSELLVSGNQILTFFITQHSTVLSQAVPLKCSLIGNPWFAQAVVLGDLPPPPVAMDPWFSSATGGIIGTF